MRTAKTTAVILSACIFLQVSAQENEDKLFKDIKPLDIALKVSIKEVKDNTGDTLWESDVLHYRNNQGTFDSVKMELRTRGKFRLETCYFPPLGLKFKKEDIKGTLLEGNKNLNLVGRHQPPMILWSENFSAINYTRLSRRTVLERGW